MTDGIIITVESLSLNFLIARNTPGERKVCFSVCYFDPAHAILSSNSERYTVAAAAAGKVNVKVLLTRGDQRVSLLCTIAQTAAMLRREKKKEKTL